MDPEQRKRIRDEYAKIATLPSGTNPVVRVNLQIGRMKDKLVIEEYGAEASPGGPPATPVTVTPGGQGLGHTHDFQQVLMSRVFSYQQQTCRLLTTHEQAMNKMVSNLEQTILAKLGVINHNLCRYVLLLLFLLAISVCLLLLLTPHFLLQCLLTATSLCTSRAMTSHLSGTWTHGTKGCAWAYECVSVRGADG